MRLFVVALVCISPILSQRAHAEPQAFLCAWKAFPSQAAGATLYAEYPLSFEVDLQRQQFRVFDGLDKKVLGEPSILSTDRAFKLEFQDLTITGLNGRAKIVVWVDRFDLGSTMTLETWLSNIALPGFTSSWMLSECKRRQF